MTNTTVDIVWNQTEYPDYYPDVKQPVHMIVFYTVVYSIVFLLGVVGNCLVVCVVYRNPTMHSVTNYFIVNLAIADILVIVFCLPITLLHNIYSGWRSGAVMCKLAPYLQGISVNASVNTMAVIAFDRYLAICHVMQSGTTRKMARAVIVFIWVFAASIASPWAVYYRHVDVSTPRQRLYVCAQDWPSKGMEKCFFLGVFVSCFAVPLLLITVFYALICYRVWNRDAPGIANISRVIYQSKIKVLKMMIVVVILFASFWMPLYAVNLRLYFGTPLDDKARGDSDSAESRLIINVLVPVAQWLGSSNSCINPVIYCLFSRKFRIGFADIIRRCTRRRLSNHNRSYINCNEYESTAVTGHQTICLHNRFVVNSNAVKH